ncbi:hypothetical protein ACSBR1_033413 [Camellia fascicularis]
MHRLGMVSKLRKCTYAPTVTTFNQKVDEFQNLEKLLLRNSLRMHIHNIGPMHFSEGDSMVK